MEQMKEWLRPELVWFVVGIVMLMMEFAIPGLVIVFFGLGALVVAIVCMVANPPVAVQLLIFIVSSLVFLVVLRRWLKSKFFGSDMADPSEAAVLDEFTGKHAVVTAPVKPGIPGKVEFKGTGWTATADEELNVGDHVIILEKDNITLHVKKA